MKGILTIELLFVLNLLTAQEWHKLFHFNASTPFSQQQIHNFQFINSDVGYFSTYETTSGSSPGNADLYMTTNSGKDWKKIYTLYEWTLGSSAALYFDFLDERNFFIFESSNGGLCHGKLYRDSVAVSLGFTPYPPPYIKNINLDTVIISSYSDENYIFLLNAGQETLSKIQIADSYIYSYPYWYDEYDLINSISCVSGFGAAIGNRNGLNLFYASGPTFDQWRRDTLDMQGSLKKVYFMNRNIGFIISNDTILFRTQNGGSDWTEITLPTSMVIHDIQFSDSKGYIIGNGGMVGSSTDYGITWDIDSLESSGAIVNLSAVNDFAYVVDGDGWIFTNNPITSAENEIKEEETLSIYPNPVTDMLRVESEDFIRSYFIYNDQGQLVRFSNAINSYLLQIDVNDLITGVYLMKITNDEGSRIVKIIKN